MRRAKKSRNGCSRCKGQRLKCDEAKPACGRCVRVGVQCPGYVQNLKWSTKYEVFNSTTGDEAVKQGQDSAKSSRPRARLEELDTPVHNGGLNLESEQTHPFDGESLGDREVPLEIELGMGVLDFTFNRLFPEMDDESMGISGIPNFDFEQHMVPLSSAATPARDARPSSVTNTQTTNQTSDPESTAITTSRKRPKRPPSPPSIFNLRQSVKLPIGAALNDVSSILTEFYFKETAQVFSCYDSQMNPFRSTVSQLWGSSKVIYYTLQSMAAASLLDNFPHLAPVGRQLRAEAIAELNNNEDQFDHKSLLALLMLGGTSSWHDPNDLGLPFFNLARKRLESMAASGKMPKGGNNYHFFEESLIYWEMLLSYMADNNSLDPMREPLEPNPVQPSRQVPHPWTGVARDCQYVVQEVGRVIRQQRKLAHSRSFTTEAHISKLQKAVARATELELRLLEFSYPTEHEVVSPEDRETPVWHLLSLAEVYRRTGLVQLYRVFPDLLRRRLPPLSSRDELDPFSPASSIDDYEKDQAEENRERRNEWLTVFALETLSLLKEIPLESGTRDFQPFLLVASCSELRFEPDPPPSTPIIDPAAAFVSQFTARSSDGRVITPLAGFHAYFDAPRHVGGSGASAFNAAEVPLSHRAIEVSRARQLIEGRLTSFLHILPPKPIYVCLDIVRATWRRLDETKNLTGSEAGDVYWMDVMIENGWETTMG
ncbi:uncharacterized protein BDZ99DRAFT_463244 [Mytilinidion resinicola]|uniref:Zn(2)-C6 fungal-type domain-containing protein n=1 Tax=Mytilinidion resinicola TaxID=574789 RepID=A0A6A6YKQ2_9PEZI|nr:uncharacterized protein BDZ99DRAFT_463244 [Mytilinidion resinicola]KAF2809446.1 hypothetical protein BDZ99DRAFT_463244 [Mytilinidion resinicola]